MPTFLRSTPALALACSMALAACGGSDGDPGAPGAAGSPGLSALSAVFAEPAGTHCADGGARIDAGLDTNANQVLDASEVASTQYLCQGGSGAAATASLVRLAAEAAGAHCTHGGTRVDVGVDTNTNGTLDTAEVVSTAYVCGTAAGTPGATGPAGAAGTTGVSSLTAITAEAAGANCPAGGQRVVTGPDTNTNGVLDAAEVATTTYLCHATAGASLQWVTVTAPSAQTRPNTGYIASSAAEVVLTLPATASLKVGDVVRVTGNGSGGWRLAQNAGQSVLTGGLPATYRTLDTAFNPLSLSGGVTASTALASSSDGRRLVAVDFTGGRLWTSMDAGQSWSTRDAQRSWTTVASSADGLKLVAGVGGDTLFTSVDGGLAWSAHGPSAPWQSVVSSADGNRFAAGSAAGAVHTSTDAGVTWTLRTTFGSPLNALASSADGNRLFAAVFGPSVRRSLDGGASWTSVATSEEFLSIASSADGTRLIAAGPGTLLYTSADSGSTWTPQHERHIWLSVTSSADGRRLAAADAAGALHVSNDFGVTWVQRGASTGWGAVVLSADGSRLAGLTGSQLWLGRQDRSTTGPTGAVSGGPDESLELQYIGGGQFVPTRHTTGSGTFQVD